MAKPNRRRGRRVDALLLLLLVGVIGWKVWGGRPRQTVSVINPAVLMVGEYYLGGDVPRPGAYTVVGRSVSLRQALVAAQLGPQQAKQVDFITIFRRTGKDDEEFIKVDPAALFERGEGNEPLQPDDQVTIVGKPKPPGGL